MLTCVISRIMWQWMDERVNKTALLLIFPQIEANTAMPLYSSERGTTNLRQHCEECKGKESDFRVNRNLATSGVSPQERRSE